jgi:hypothetical protein
MSTAHAALKAYLIVVEHVAFSPDALVAALAQCLCHIGHARQSMCLAASSDLISAEAECWLRGTGFDLACLC